MKIGLLHYTYPPVIGGVERVMASHAALFREAGHEVTVFAGEGGAIVLPELRRGGAIEAGPLARLLRPLLCAQEIVFLHNVCTMPFHPALTEALRRLAREVRLVAWVHDLAAANSDYPVPAESIHLRTACEEMEYVAVSALRQWQVMEHLGARRCRVIPNGIDPLEEWGVPPEWRPVLTPLPALVLLHPARLLRRKNVETSLRVLAALRAAGREAVLLITAPEDPHHAPSTAYARELHALREALGLGQHAHFLAEQGPLTDAAVASLYRAAEAVLLPSHSEGFGLPVLEAALHGTPLFAPDLDPFRSLIGGHPHLYASGSTPEQIAGLMMRQLDASPPIQARRAVLQQYAWPAVYRNFLAPLLRGEETSP